MVKHSAILGIIYTVYVVGLSGPKVHVKSRQNLFCVCWCEGVQLRVHESNNCENFSSDRVELA